jgi:predicted ester cyclase
MKKFFLSAFIAALLFTACNDAAKDDAAGDNQSATASQDDKEERNKKTALASMEAINATHNVDSILRDATPDAVDYGEGSMPPVKGIDSIKVGFQQFLNAFPDYKGENMQAVADGDYVYVSADWSGTFQKDMMGMKATGKSFKIKDVDIFKFNADGKIIEHRAIVPWGVVMQAVGAQMPK